LKGLLPIMIFTLILQSGMGAWAVKYPQTPAVMATHFGISLVCFASVYLVMRVLWAEMPTSVAAIRAVPPGYARLAWVTLLWTIVVAYVGAYMRHSGAELACYTWPLCNGSVIPDLSSPGVGVAWSHRLVALIAMVLVFGMVWWVRSFRVERPDLYRTAHWAAGLILLQAVVGGSLIFSRISLASTLSHAALMALLFAALADTVWRATPRRRGAETPEGVQVSGTPAIAR
jgi:cytochrome c oxidase assembly protein subunit 15